MPQVEEDPAVLSAPFASASAFSSELMMLKGIISKATRVP
jgi:hypothetical protein